MAMKWFKRDVATGIAESVPFSGQQNKGRVTTARQWTDKPVGELSNPMVYFLYREKTGPASDFGKRPDAALIFS